jgi:adenylate cyclase
VRLKNIADPVRVFSLQVGVPLHARPVAVPKPPERRSWLKPALAGLGIMTAFALVLVADRFDWRPWSTSSGLDASRGALRDKLATAPRLSFAVLPFDASNGDSDQQHLADVFTDGVTTGLSQLKGSLVVARDAASVYKGKPRDAGKVGRELGARYAVEGSMNLTGEAVAVNAELFSTETGTPIWTDRIEGERSQLGKLQDDLVARLANTLGAEPVKPASPLMLRERAAASPVSGADLRANRPAIQPPLRQAASPPPSQAAPTEQPPAYCGTPAACRRNGGTFHPLSAD